MSKRSKKKDYQPFNIILVIVILFILTPIIPFLFGLLLLMRFVNLKGKYGVIVSGIGLLIIGAFFNEILNDFLREFQISLSNFLNCILHRNFNYDFGFLTYKNTSWIIIFFVSIFLASYRRVYSSLLLRNWRHRPRSGGSKYRPYIASSSGCLLSSWVSAASTFPT